MIIYVYRMVKGEKKNTSHPFAADKSRGEGALPLGKTGAGE